MAETTGIGWVDSTRNFWTGCTKVGPGCDGCYAAAKDQRFKGGHWGAGAPRQPHLEGAARDLRNWNRKAAVEIAAGKRKRWTVFIDSQSDFFDNEVPPEWRLTAWDIMRECTSLTFLIVTKRIGNAPLMVPMDFCAERYPHVWIGATIVNQEEADRDIPKLLILNAAVLFVSYEPALGPINFSPWLRLSTCRGCGYAGPLGLQRLDPQCARCGIVQNILQWIIVGGESDQAGHKARPFNIRWARRTVEQCRAAGVPVFVKQLGSAILVRNDSGDQWPDEDAFSDAIPEHYAPAYQGEEVVIRLKDRAGADPAEWPEDLRIQQFPR